MRLFRLFFELLFIGIVMTVVFNMAMAKYLWMQAQGQMKIILGAVAIEQALLSNDYDLKEKQALQLILAVKRFSVDSLGYKPIKNYSTVYFQGHKPILWITTACQPFAFEAYNWEFPYLGQVAYKGFFEKAKAEEELKRLQSLGLDADLGTVSAWSTLGWLPEPILSNWLKREPEDLANLIFHELFHGTVYVKNQVDLNENLASFIADKATSYYFKNDTATLVKYRKRGEEEKLMNQFVLDYKQILETAYTQWQNQNVPIKIRGIKKDSLLRRFVASAGQFLTADSLLVKKYLQKAIKAKNAYFMHFERYDSKYDSLNQVFEQKFNGNLKSYIKYLKINNQSL